MTGMLYQEKGEYEPIVKFDWEDVHQSLQTKAFHSEYFKKINEVDERSLRSIASEMLLEWGVERRMRERQFHAGRNQTMLAWLAGALVFHLADVYLHRSLIEIDGFLIYGGLFGILVTVILFRPKRFNVKEMNAELMAIENDRNNGRFE